jgi:hypothetical protein
MRYFHTLSDSTVKRLIRKGTTLVELKKRYKQPDWCNYPDALAGIMGCWSLMDLLDLRHQISKQYCKGCDCFLESE